MPPRPARVPRGVGRTRNHPGSRKNPARHHDPRQDVQAHRVRARGGGVLQGGRPRLPVRRRRHRRARRAGMLGRGDSRIAPQRRWKERRDGDVSNVSRSWGRERRHECRRGTSARRAPSTRRAQRRRRRRRRHSWLASPPRGGARSRSFAQVRSRGDALSPTGRDLPGKLGARVVPARARALRQGRGAGGGGLLQAVRAFRPVRRRGHGRLRGASVRALSGCGKVRRRSIFGRRGRRRARRLRRLVARLRVREQRAVGGAQRPRQ
mmetsp:Transcript_13086/g.59070  ORF Transcript_13086/g.59070 Transcript_13086/m.59070 type:complete len:265 (+) Transcript_13086:531-1325(+)